MALSAWLPRPLTRAIERLPYVRGLRAQLEEYRTAYPPGHYYSPIPAEDDIRRHLDAPQPVGTPAGIELSVDSQLRLLDRLAPLQGQLPFGDAPSPDLRYHYDNPFFRHCDAVFLYGMLRLERPQRVVEVGSGYSSALMLDVAERFLPHAPVFTFIDPYAERLRGLLHRGDQSKVEVLEQPAQAAPRELFESLNPGDVLFVDSSHVAKMASDVNYLVFEVLPALRPGVLCHFHDVLYPFEYPADWALRWKGFAWNEAYLLRAFLSFNREFEIVAFNSYLEQCHRERLAAAAPVALLSRGQSLWLRRRLA